MASITKRVAAAIQKEFVEGTVFRVDLDRVDIAPNGSTGILRSLPLTGDRDKVKPGDPVRVINVAGERVALVGDVVISDLPEAIDTDASNIERAEILGNFGTGGDGTNAQTLQGYQPKPTGADAHVILTDDYGNPPVNEWRVLPGAVYNGSTSMYFVGNYVSLFPKGTRVRLRVSGAYRYMVVTSCALSLPNTYLTLNGGSDYSAGVCEEFTYSHVLMPEGWPEWFNYYPSWTATYGAPSIGNGSLIGRFKMDGSLVTISIRFVAGTTTTFGSGTWAFGIPTNPDASATFPYLGTARMRRPAQFNYLFVAQLANTDTGLQYFMPMNSGGQNINNLSATYPVTWAANDYIEIQLQYKC